MEEAILGVGCIDQDLFHLLDANGGDTASQEELVRAGWCFIFLLDIFYFGFCPWNRKRMEIESQFHVIFPAFAEMDEDEDGEITQEEFIKVKFRSVFNEKHFSTLEISVT